MIILSSIRIFWYTTRPYSDILKKWPFLTFDLNFDPLRSPWFLKTTCFQSSLTQWTSWHGQRSNVGGGGRVSRLTGLRLNRQYYRKPWSFLIAVECSEITKNLKEKYHFLKRQNIEKNILNKTNWEKLNFQIWYLYSQE